MTQRDDAAVLNEIAKCFASVERPEHFTNFRHCEECADHDELLRSRDLKTLSRRDAGNVGWDPVTMTSPQGFAYYFPALARLTLEDQTEHIDWYGLQLFNHLRPSDISNERRQFFTPTQRQAVRKFVQYLVTTRGGIIDNWGAGADADEVLAYWAE